VYICTSTASHTQHTHSLYVYTGERTTNLHTVAYDVEALVLYACLCMLCYHCWRCNSNTSIQLQLASVCCIFRLVLQYVLPAVLLLLLKRYCYYYCLHDGLSNHMNCVCDDHTQQPIVLLTHTHSSTVLEACNSIIIIKLLSECMYSSVSCLKSIAAS
jgi:hypothetical protein